MTAVFPAYFLYTISIFSGCLPKKTSIRHGFAESAVMDGSSKKDFLSDFAMSAFPGMAFLLPALLSERYEVAVRAFLCGNPFFAEDDAG